MVIIHSDTHQSDDKSGDSRFGRVYPLRDGEILLVGRHPAPAEVRRRNGELGPPDHYHLFPKGETYKYVSRKHLTIEMVPGGETILTDYSLHGVYLERAAIWLRRQDPADPPQVHRLTAPETAVLMDDLGEPNDPTLTDRRSHYRLHFLQPIRRADPAS